MVLFSSSFSLKTLNQLVLDLLTWSSYSTRQSIFFFVFCFLQFREILFVDETTNEKAFFTYKLNSSLVAEGNYQTQISGLWLGRGVAATNHEYQLLICDHSFYSGFFISGYTNCYKRCNSWCEDWLTPYFRSASTDSSYAGVAFNVNGHRTRSSRLMSVGLR